MIIKNASKSTLKKITILLFCLIFLLSALMTGYAQKKEIIEFKLAHCQNEGGAYSIFARKFIELVKEKSEGQIIGTEYPSMVLGAEREVAEGVQLGTIEVTNITVAPLSNFVPQLQVLDLPFVFATPEEAYKKIDGPLGDKLLELINQAGFKALVFTDCGGRHLTTRAKPIYKKDDLKGLKMRVMEIPLHIETYRLLGCNPTVIGFSELFTALQQGVVDGMDMPISLIWRENFYEAQKYLMLTNHFFAFSVMIVNPDFWNKLLPEQQRFFLEAAKEAKLYQRQQVKKLDSDCLDLLKTKSDLEIIPSEDIDLESFRNAVGPVYKEYEDIIGKDLIDLVLQ